MAFVLGMQAVIEIQTDGVAGSDGWNAVDKARDSSIQLESEVTDTTIRGNNGWKSEVQTLRTANVEFELLYDTTDTQVAALLAAFLSNGVIGVRALTLPSADANAEGLVADMMVSTFSVSQSLTEAQTVSVTLVIAPSDTAPTWTDTFV